MPERSEIFASINTYPQAEAFIMEALPMFQKVGKKAIGTYTLDGVRAFLRYLGNPHDVFPSIHIAGTNGKGSTAHMLAAVYQTNGYQVGLFTSPHLITYRERMKINGSYIPEDYILNWVQNHFDYLRSETLSFFEMSMGLACSWFRDQNVDIAIMETGLGGRLDATNVIHPLLSIITNIDLDHQDVLGESLPQIAREKAGIIKVGTPVVLGNMDESLRPIFEEKAMELDAPLYSSEEITVRDRENNSDGVRYHLTSDPFPASQIFLPTLAPYQEFNLLTVLHAMKYLKTLNGLELSAQLTTNGLEDFLAISSFRGRYEIIHRNPLVIADAAHNPGGIRFFNPLFQNNNVHLHLIFGLVRDKDVDEILSLLPTEATYYFCAANVARAMDAYELQAAAVRHGLEGDVFESPLLALQSLIENADQQDIGLVIGSIYLLEEILQYGHL